MFTVYPAIDLLGGKCVRLFQGDYKQSTVFDDSPVSVARSFYNQGAKWLHVVDLDGAKAGHPVNREVIAQIAAQVPVHIETGGGIRSMACVSWYLEHGIRRVILGSSAISDPAFTRQALKQYPGKVAVGLDVRQGKIAVNGWLQVSDIRAADLAKKLIEYGAIHFIYTDISRDGAMQGANIEGAARLAEEIGRPVVLSGGVSSLDEIKEILKKRNGEISGAIIGKALYTKQISIPDVVRLVTADAGKTDYPLS
ncbi:1-(5-phosphoribosyl)-5-[(5-phosphoribosylamino)methylideneamino]imidazole-4-carboxamide isomerase [Sporolactobacillus sp. Y61]|uniref:1-(5-phosphoribosyl)-5-[(5-phosphoribosylamino)methylideneamino] imidazole-4-carboxamide isomerase n=1 Tax=Sporolactobacillus sp. Y61 TaxID=3160863 RepID=A0AAU8IEU2_9BACL